MGFNRFFNKVTNGANKFFGKGGTAGTILGKVSSGLKTVGNIADKVVSNPIVQAGGNALGAYVGDPMLGSQISTGAKLLSNATHHGNNVLERAQNIQKSISAGPQFA